jgi:hypothetical protein
MSAAQKTNCLYCGHNPVPHFVNWYFESLNVLLTPLRLRLLDNFFSNWLRRLARKVNLPFLAVRVFKFIGIISYQTEVKQCKVRRAQVLWEEANRRGIQMAELLLFGKPFDCYIAEQQVASSFISNPSWSRIKDKRSRIIFSGLPRPDTFDPAALDVLDDKIVLKQNFQQQGLPVPPGGSVWTFRQALEIFRRIQKPAIVKPRAGSRGRHSTTFVFKTDDLKAAFKIAKQLCFWVVVEEQLMGPVYRATVIDYKLQGVLRGDPPQVAGDGIHSIQELVGIKNRQPHPGVEDIKIDGNLERFLQRQSPLNPPLLGVPQKSEIFGVSIKGGHPPSPPLIKGGNQRGGLALTDVPPAGKLICLSEKIGISYGGSSSEDFAICHPDNQELFVLAAKAVKDPLVGFDFIIPDISQSWEIQRCGFIEANSLPFINLHHDPLGGTPRNVAAKVWDMVGFI